MSIAKSLPLVTTLPHQNTMKEPQSQQSTKVDVLLASILHDKDVESKVWVPRFKLRLAITSEWNIGAGKRVLDIGCGQGESSVTLALQLGPTSHITGIDTARPDYGGPYTVAQSHEYIGRTVVGQQINFLRTDAATLFQTLNQPASDVFDGAALCHSLWYFPDQAAVYELFQTLALAGMERVYIAEYAFEASLQAQTPHVLAARAQALFHAYKTPREAGTKTLNVRAAPDKNTVMDAASTAGFTIARQGTITPEADMLEGYFEARYTKGGGFAARVRAENLSKEHEEEILSYGPKIEEAMDRMNKRGVEYVRAMDVWWAEFRLRHS
jgi:ubiquinone/menaquinone biosynthesis C-methylase UbiE